MPVLEPHAEPEPLPTMMVPINLSPKRDDVDAIRLRPHPYEFNLYFDV